MRTPWIEPGSRNMVTGDLEKDLDSSDYSNAEIKKIPGELRRDLMTRYPVKATTLH